LRVFRKGKNFVLTLGVTRDVFLKGILGIFEKKRC